MRARSCGLVVLLALLPTPADALISMGMGGSTAAKMQPTAWEHAIERALDMERLTSGGHVAQGFPQAAPKTLVPTHRASFPISAPAPSQRHVISHAASEQEISASETEIDVSSTSAGKEGVAMQHASREMQQAAMLKEKGTALFKARRFEEAALRYHEAKAIADDCKQETGGSKLSLACSLNLASCSIEMGDHTNSIRHCSDVLEVERSNHKALFRRGLSYRSMGQISNGAPEGGEKKGLAAGLFMPAADWEKRTQRLLVLAFQDVTRAFSIAPNDKSVGCLLEAIRKDMRDAGIPEPKREETGEASPPLSSPSSSPAKKFPNVWKLAARIAAGGNIVLGKPMGASA